MEIVAVVNRKGGIGKTATAQALGAGLIRKGHSVLFLDLDSQTNLSFSLGAKTNGLTSMDIMTGKGKIQNAIQNTPQGDIIAGSETLAGADMTIDGKGKEYHLKKALEGIAGIYDYVVIDTPAALGTLTINALTAAASAVIPVQADIYSLQGIGQLNKAIEAVKKHSNHDLYIRGILITRYNGRAVLSKDMQANLQDAAKQLNTKLYSTPIRECIAIKEAQACQQDIFSYAPNSNAAKDYEVFVNEFLGKRRRKNGKKGL